MSGQEAPRLWSPSNPVSGGECSEAASCDETQDAAGSAGAPLHAVMSSSHNVSSWRELEGAAQRGQSGHSVCLSHASRDHAVAGDKELFSASDKKRVIELKQRQLAYVAPLFFGTK